jgi:hypothetical protein
MAWRFNHPSYQCWITHPECQLHVDTSALQPREHPRPWRPKPTATIGETV